MKQHTVQKMALDLLFIAAGTFLYAVGINLLIQPNHLTPGGFAGIATQLNFLFGIPIGLLTMLLNVPLLIVGLWKLGARMVLSTVIATLLSSTFIDVLQPVVQPFVYRGDLLIVALFGGVISGLGMGLLFLRGATLGGNDIVAMLVNRRWPGIPIGKFLFAFNALVIAGSMAVYHQVESALCSAVCAFVSARVLDAVLVSADSGKALLIVTEKPYELAAQIHLATQRGATVIPAYGTHQREERYVLLCVAHHRDISRIRRILRAEDPQAFVIVENAGEILGHGFKKM